VLNVYGRIVPVIRRPDCEASRVVRTLLWARISGVYIHMYPFTFKYALTYFAGQGLFFV